MRTLPVILQSSAMTSRMTVASLPQVKHAGRRA